MDFFYQIHILLFRIMFQENKPKNKVDMKFNVFLNGRREESSAVQEHSEFGSVQTRKTCK